ncbi:MAG: choice-of-anchor D domain-containing protein, partial [Verrucomicrobiae bacterium]|nr:choice-of-anchor D domain-containing protein [Verrucomicrobiae bacterium]
SSPFTLTFEGTKSDHSIVTHSVTTDGVFDGTGPLTDFQTILFPASFSDLISVRLASSTLFMADNINVTVEGQELPPEAPPTAPLLYDMTFDPPKHEVDRTINVGGYYAPKSINFGNPIVRASIGGMDNAVELKTGDGGFYSSSQYEQFRIGVGRNAAAYRLELDVYVDSIGPDQFSDDFSILFDGPPVQNFYLEEQNKVTVFQSGVGSGISHLGTYTPKQKIHLRFDIDMVSGKWTIRMDDVIRLNNGPYNNSADLRDIRIHFSDSSAGGAWAAVDNIRLWSFDEGNGIPVGPDLKVTPSSLTFPNTRVGESVERVLRISNQGEDVAVVSGVDVTGAGFSIDEPFPQLIYPGGIIDLPVKFTPLVNGATSGSLSILSNDSQNPTRNVNLSGEGYTENGLVLSHSSIDVSFSGTSVQVVNLTLENQSTGAINWSLAADNGAIGSASDISANDPDLSKLWGLRDPSVYPGGIGAQEAWKLTTGSPRVVVG